MSAHTALVSLRQILVDSLCRSKSRRLQNLVKRVDLLLNFLETSSSSYEARQVAGVERKMRDAASRAEHLINHSDNDDAISSGNSIFLSFLFMLLSPLTARLDVIPVWIPLILVEALICIINAAFLYLWVRDRYGFPTRKASREWRRLFFEFKIIVEEVNQIKESSSSSSSSGISALISLRQILDPIILDSAGYNKDHLKSLQEKVIFLLENASTSSSTYNASIQSLDAKIRDAVYEAKRALLIEFKRPRKSGLIFEWRRFSARLNVLTLISPVCFYMLIRLMYCVTPSEHQTSRLEILGQMCIAYASYICSASIVCAVSRVQYIYEALENQEWAHVVDDFDSIVRDVIKIKDGCGEAGDLSTAAALFRQDSGCDGRDVVVGLESDIEEIKARLFQDSSKLEVVSIVGMGGIGKTTLANKVYHDPHIVSRFDIRAWTMISQGNTLRHVLLSLLNSAHMLAQEEMCQDSDQELGVHLHKYLTSRRYLIVVDDVWDTQIWEFLSRHFPDNCNHSRVLFTSRLPNVAIRLDSRSHLHHMQCLDENHSWDLLCREVFGVEGYHPLELESIGKKIAHRCGGLPLAIVVIGGLLSQNIDIQVWRDVAEKLQKSQLQDIKEQCLDILSLSYNHLPRHLKPCFLYMGVFLAHSEIPISTLVHLWIAEGFLRPCESKTMEEEAEGYVKDLIERNLISVSKRSCNGKMRRCSMHDLLRDVCVENARKEKFRHVVESGGYIIARGGPDESPRSLSIDPNVVRGDAIHDYLDPVHLRVLNLLEKKFDVFPRRITQLVSLRYLAFHYDGSLPIPPSMYKLQYLETLVLHHSSFGDYSFLPSSIWRMPNLRHIYVKPGCYMFKLLGHQFFLNSSILKNLQTLVGIRNFTWTRDIIEKLPNLKKLGISYDFSSSANWSTYQLENLVYLEKLEGLKITVKYDDLWSAMSHDPPKLAFPKKLKKLSLTGCRIPWVSMTAIGALPNLEALKLRCRAFCGTSWETVEGEFPRLVFLLLEETSFTSWKTEESHFSRLRRLVLRSCIMLEEIPFSFGDISSLELIQLVDCHHSVVASAKRIQEEQESMGNEVLRFHIEQRRREVDGMNFGNLEARGVGPGFFQVIEDAMVSIPMRHAKLFMELFLAAVLVVEYTPYLFCILAVITCVARITTLFYDFIEL